MINKETILSNYNDRLTLLQWLKKVELALQNASAKEFRVNKLGNATLTFSIVFDDDTELTTGPIVLEQGESVASASITDGHLLLTLTNGDVLDAGSVGAVTGFSIDGSQHLIVTYQDGTTQDLGAIFQGNVNIAGDFTANSIIENMNGYDMEVSQYAPTGATITPIYFGICKNGNKLTLVSFFNIVRTAVIGDQLNTLFYVTIPSAVGAKIYPFTLGEFNNVIAVNKTPAVTDIAQANNVDFKYYLRKQSNTGIVIHCRTLDDLALNTNYLVRIEVTFLLSQNYAI